MSDHPNIQLMEKVYASFGGGDVATAGTYWHEDSVHHYPGRNPLSGDHVGIEDSTAFANQMWELTNGNLRMVQKFSRHRDANTVQIYDDNREDLAGRVADLLGRDA